MRRDREWADSLGLGDRLELVDYLPRGESLRYQRDSEALLLLVPDAGGRGKGVLSGKVFEYLAAGRPILAAVPPDGAAAELIRETGAGVVVAPDDVDAIRAALVDLHARFANGGLASVELARAGRGPALPARARRGHGSVARRDRMTTQALTLSRRGAADRVLAQPVLDGLFLLTIFTVTFHKLQWELAGSLTLSDILTSVFLVLFAWDRVERDDGGFTRTAMVAFGFLLLFALVYLAGFYSLDTGQALAQWAKGMVKFVLHFGFLVTGIALLARRGLRFYWYALAAFLGGIGLDAVYGVVQLVLAEAGVNLDEILIQPITSRQTGINVFGAVGGTQEVFRPNALTGDPNHLGIELVIPLLVLTPLYLRLEAGHRLKTPLAISLAFMLLVELATLSRSALLGLGCGALILALPYRRHLRRPAFLVPLGAVARARRDGRRGPARLLPHRPSREDEHEPRRGLAALRRLLVRPGHPLDAPVPRSRAEQLRRLLRVRHGTAGLRPALVLRRDDRRDRDRRRCALRRVRRLDLPPARSRPADRPRALRGRRPARGADPARGVGDDGRARRDARRERLLPHDDLLLLLRVRDPRGGAPGRRSRRAARMKVVVLTTSYPREPDDVAGVFVRDAVEHLRAAGVEVAVVSPASFRHFGLAYGDGIVGNLRGDPWKALLVPAFLALVRTRPHVARLGRRPRPRALAAVGAAGAGTGKPFVLQLWGTDVELARRVPWVARRLVRTARLVLCPSQALASRRGARRARRPRRAERGRDPETRFAEPDDPPHVLFVGRLSEEKGIAELPGGDRGTLRV